MTIITEIQRLARRRLGRPARRGGRWLDWPACWAVKDAAHSLGLTEPLERWASDASLHGLATSYVSRYQQAYGIGVGATAGHIDPIAGRQLVSSLARVA